MRNATTFSGFVDVYNIEKEKINGRNLYIKRFEEAWLSWKLKSWLFKLSYLGHSTIQQLAAFQTEYIEKIVEIYFMNFQDHFVYEWQNFHETNCSSKNKMICQSMCKYESI